MPPLGVFESLADQGFGQFPDPVDILGNWDEDLWVHEAELRRVPAREHLEAHQVAALEIDLLLVVRNELAGRDAPPDAGLELVAKAQLALHQRFEPAEAVPAALLGMVH